MPYADAFVKLVERYLEQKDWTQQQLADRLGRPQSFVSKLLSRERVLVDVDLVVEIANAFDVSSRTIWGRLERAAQILKRARAKSDGHAQ